MMPHNAATGARYRGINTIMLGMSPLAFISGDPRWATYKQAADRGGSCSINHLHGNSSAPSSTALLYGDYRRCGNSRPMTPDQKHSIRGYIGRVRGHKVRTK